MTKRFLLLCLLCFFGLSGFAQFQISGKTTDTQGDIIPFVSVLLKNTNKAVSSNAEGQYLIQIDSPSFTLVFSAIGYKTVEKKFQIKSNTVWNQSLEPETYLLQTVEIKVGKEDPAYEIIRKTISARKKHLQEVKAFKSDVYIKGLQKLVGAPKKFFGQDVQQVLSLDTNRNGIIYLSESQSQFSYQQPNQYKEVMVSSKVSGRNNAFSYNKASDMLINFYDNLLLTNAGLSSRGFISPISENALFYYNYKLLGRSDQDGKIINKIEVKPKRKNDPVFQGVIYIIDDSYRLFGVDLNLTKEVGINLLDTLNIQQEFHPVQKIYMPGNQKFLFKGNLLGFKFEGYFVTIFSNTELVDKFPKKYFSPEILLISKAVNKKDSLYWAENRPIPLSPEEIKDYAKKDSLAQLRSSKPYLDSLERANNKLSALKLLLLGYTINDRVLKKSWSFDPLKNALIYNTVEGFALKFGISYNKTFENDTRLSIRPQIRYGFANKDLTANVSSDFLYSRRHRGRINFALGTDFIDLNNLGSIPILSNTLNSLLFEKNLLKFMKKEFISLGTSRELAPGLNGSINLQWSQSTSLLNSSSYAFRHIGNRSFTPNNPFSPNAETYLFAPYKAFTLSAFVNYTFGQTYTTSPNGRFYSPAKYPTLYLNYKKGFKDIFDSVVDYDYLGFEIAQNNISLGLYGKTALAIGLGKFINNKNLYYPDFKHYRGNSVLLYAPELRKFRFLDFYLHSTPDQFLEAHIQHNFGGFLFNKIPGLRKLKLNEMIGFNYLTQPGKRNYSELFFGFERLGFGLSYGFAFDEQKKTDQGFRFTYVFSF